MTITLAPQIETRLRRKAARMGEDADRLIEALLMAALADEASEEELREEYYQLVALELKDGLSEAQTARLHQVTQALDDLDMHSPAAAAMFERLDKTGRKLDKMLELLRSLPLAASAQGSSAVPPMCLCSTTIARTVTPTCDPTFSTAVPTA